MKIACIVSGQPRHPDKGLPGLMNFMEGIDVDYFVHHWLTPSDFNKTFSSCNADKSIWKVDQHTKELVIKLLSPKKYIFESQIHFTPEEDYESRSETNQSSSDFMSMTFSKKKAFSLLKEYAENVNLDYDFVIVTRSDVRLNSKLLPILKECDRNIFYTLSEPGSKWGSSHLNDPFVISSPANIEHFCSLFDTFRDIWKSGIPLCGHRLAMAQMKIVDGLRFESILSKNEWSYIRS